jgi:hypothetical protein
MERVLPPDMGRVSRVIYIDERIEVHTDRVTAKKDIDAGTVLMIEWMFAGTEVETRAAIICDRDLFHALYPRREEYSNIFEAGVTKLEMNAFEHYGQKLISKAITRLNHNCKPSAIVTFSKNKGRVFGSALSIERIAAGVEVSISYDPDAGHDGSFPLTRDIGKLICEAKGDTAPVPGLYDYGFKCKCGMDGIQRFTQQPTYIVQEAKTKLACSSVMVKHILDFCTKQEEVLQGEEVHKLVRVFCKQFELMMKMAEMLQSV